MPSNRFRQQLALISVVPWLNDLNTMGTPLEIIGGISAVVQILQTALDIAERLKSASDKKVLTSIINRNHKEVKSIRDIITAIDEEEALQTQSIVEEIGDIGKLAIDLEDLLQTMADASFISRVTHAKDHKTELGNLTGEIAKAKFNLTMKIQNAHVGLTRLANKQFAVQIEMLEKVDQNLRILIEEFDGLSIKAIVEGRVPNNDGAVLLEKSDLQQLGLEPEDESSAIKEGRIIDSNMAYNQSLMINGTIGTEGFIKEKYIKIYNNITRHQAMMINANISTDVWQQLREDRFKTLEMAARGAFANNQDSENPQDDGSRHGRGGATGKGGNPQCL